MTTDKGHFFPLDFTLNSLIFNEACRSSIKQIRPASILSNYVRKQTAGFKRIGEISRVFAFVDIKVFFANCT